MIMNKRFMLIFVFLFQSLLFAYTPDYNQINNRLSQVKSDKKTRIISQRNDLIKEFYKARAGRIEPPPKSKTNPFDDYRRMMDGPQSVSQNQKKLKYKTYPDRESKLKDIADINNRIAECNIVLGRIDSNDINEFVEPLKPSFHIGDFGIISERSDQWLKILHVIDSEDLICEFCYGYGPGANDYAPIKKTWTPRSYAPPPPPEYPQLTKIWLRGIKTESLVDDMKIKPNGLFIITGTENYFTLDGAKETVFVFEPLILPPDSPFK